MLDIAATIALHFAVILAMAAIAQVWRGHGVAPAEARTNPAMQRVRFRPIMIGLGCTTVYWLALVLSGDLQNQIPFTAGLNWNWAGKVVAIATSLALVAALPMLSARGVGLTWRQRPGSLRPALLVVAAICALSLGAEALVHDGTDTSLERLLYQATMPGIDEELFMRGILLALMVQGFGPSRERAGAPFGWAEWAVTFLFAAGHGLRVADGALAFDPLLFALTGTIGAGLAWLRQRTGSLVVPILAHNLVNLGNSFF